MDDLLNTGLGTAAVVNAAMAAKIYIFDGDALNALFFLVLALYIRTYMNN